MSRYRKIEVRTWSDEKFRKLSAIPPSGQGLWFFLLTGPHTTAIPGLFRAGRAAMAEELNWEQEDFDEAFREVSDKGMAKADFKAKLVWLPNAIRHNKPESPNVVRGWRVELDLLPECELKREAMVGIRKALERAGASFVKAFDELLMPEKDDLEKSSTKASTKPSLKASSKASPNQEQEQEQEYPSSLRSEGERADATPPPPAPKSPKPKREKREDCTLATFLANCKAQGVKPVPDDHAIRRWSADAGITDEMLQIAWIAFRERYTEDEQYRKKRYRDWAGTFSNSVKGRWFGLWMVSGDGSLQWTSAGLQRKRVLDARQTASREGEHEPA